jgi:hypothetical protein
MQDTTHRTILSQATWGVAYVLEVSESESGKRPNSERFENVAGANDRFRFESQMQDEARMRG